MLVLLVPLVLGSAWLGVAMREGTWQRTAPVRYVPDMVNAWTWGSRAAGERWGGYFGIYDEVVRRAVASGEPGANYGLDYVPLRLAVMTLWAGAERRAGVTAWQNTRETNAPLLAVNYAMDAVSAIAAWGITTHVLFLQRRRALAGVPGQEGGWGISVPVAWALGALAGSLVWLNPAMHVSGFGRPTWDVWVVTFYLLACWAMVGRLWAVAGLVLAVGAMFKGQQLAVIAFFVPWAVVSGGLSGLLSWSAGLVLGTGLVTWPWMVGGPGDRAGLGWAAVVAAGGAGAAAAGGWWARLRRANVRRSDVRGAKAQVGSAAASVDGSAGGSVGRPVMSVELPEVSVKGDGRRLWRGVVPGGRAAVWGLAVVLGAVVTYRVWAGAASMAWFEVAFRYGAEKFGRLEVGGSMCLAGILQNRFGWQADDVVFGGAWGGVTMTQLLAGVYGACAIACGIAAGVGHRRGDPRRILVAMPAVWICFFAFMAKMHERYLLWGAVAAALCVGRSMGLALLGLVLSLASWAMTLRVMIQGSATRGDYRLLGMTGDAVQRLIDPMIPDAGWGVMVAAGVFLWAAVAPARRERTTNEAIRGTGP